MPKASKVTEQEFDDIARKTAIIKTTHPKKSLREIGKVVGRSAETVLRAMSDKKYSRYRDFYKKKIDLQRFESVFDADSQVFTAIKENKLTPYQLIGLSKTYYEQSFGLLDEQNRVPSAQVNVQIIEGKNQTHNIRNNQNSEYQAQSDDV